jgi:hypothetical protein
MSAFIVSKAHIDALVQAGLAIRRIGNSPLRWDAGERPAWTGDHEAYRIGCQTISRELTHDQADRVGAMLWNENVKSVDHRYNDHTDREVYRFPAMTKLRPPVVILKAIHCYRYQACEHPEWESSEAFAFCNALEAATMRNLPGYDDAPWGIDK